MQDRYEVQPTEAPVHGSIRPPGSKSITNRALICAALADGASVLSGALDSEDTRVMVHALQQLGLQVTVDLARQSIRIQGCGGRIPATSEDLYAANSGTTLRFLAALLTLGNGTYRLDGNARMRQRPVEDLLVALRQLGATAESEAGNGCPPVVITTDGLAGGTAKVRGDISSQFLSALLMAAPYARRDVRLEVQGTLVSQPYVQMTLDVMKGFGVAGQIDNLTKFAVPAGQRYRSQHYLIEPDASAASYFWAAAAITGGTVTVEGLSRGSLQGDVAFCDCLEQMGCQVNYSPSATTVRGGPLRGITTDMNAISDTAQTLGAVALFAEGQTIIKGVAHIRHKETDRIGDLATELRRLGAEVEVNVDGLTITPAPLRSAEIETYNDHRMAMSLALAGLRVPGIVIKDPGCTEKTYPNYFKDLERLIQGR